MLILKSENVLNSKSRHSEMLNGEREGVGDGKRDGKRVAAWERTTGRWIEPKYKRQGESELADQIFILLAKK